MTTCRDVIQGALKLLGVLAAGETADAVDAGEALDELNKMAASWSAKNVHTGWPTVTLDDIFPLEERHRAGVEAMLAWNLQTAYGSALTEIGVRRAMEGWQLLFNDYGRPDVLVSDIGLLGFPTGRRWYMGGQWWRF